MKKPDGNAAHSLTDLHGTLDGGGIEKVTRAVDVVYRHLDEHSRQVVLEAMLVVLKKEAASKLKFIVNWISYSGRINNEI